jgi:hypothetical protein
VAGSLVALVVHEANAGSRVANVANTLLWALVVVVVVVVVVAVVVVVGLACFFSELAFLASLRGVSITHDMSCQ